MIVIHCLAASALGLWCSQHTASLNSQYWSDSEPSTRSQINGSLDVSQVLDSTEPFQRDAMAPFRMPVIDKYKEMGTIVMGKSESGLVTVGDKLLVMPNKCAPALCRATRV